MCIKSASSSNTALLCATSLCNFLGSTSSLLSISRMQPLCFQKVFRPKLLYATILALPRIQPRWFQSLSFSISFIQPFFSTTYSTTLVADALHSQTPVCNHFDTSTYSTTLVPDALHSQTPVCNHLTPARTVFSRIGSRGSSFLISCMQPFSHHHVFNHVGSRVFHSPFLVFNHFCSTRYSTTLVPDAFKSQSPACKYFGSKSFFFQSSVYNYSGSSCS